MTGRGGRSSRWGGGLAGDAGVGAADAVGALGGLAVGVEDVDLLFADGFGDLALLGLDVLLEADALLGHDALVGDDLFLVQGDLVLFLGDRRPGRRVSEVGLGDRLALDPDFLAANGNRVGDLVFDDVLLQAHAARLALAGADAQLLLRTRDRGVGLGAADVVADDAPRALRGALARGALGQAAVRARLAVLQAVVAVQLRLLLLGELAVGVGVRRVFNLRLGIRHAHVAARVARLGDRDERDPRA